MRVLYLSPSGSLGGAERVLLNVMGATREAFPDAELLLLCLTDGPLLQRAAQIGVAASVFAAPSRLLELGDSQQRRAWPMLFWRAAFAGASVWSYARRLRRELRALAPSLIHSNGIKTHVLSALAKPKHCPLAWHAHDFYGARPFASRLLRRYRHQADGILAISRAVEADVRRVLPGRPVHLLLNTVDVDAFSPGTPQPGWLDRQAGVPPAEAGTVRVGLLATYARWKGQDVFLRAIAQMKRSPQPRALRFYIVGGPVYQTRNSQFSVDELKRLASELDVARDVFFVGFQQDPQAAYRSLDVVVHASTQPEPFGLTIIEAMACGKPVVAAAAGGAAELFRPDVEGVAVPPGDATALADALRRLAEHPEERQRLGLAARDAAVRRFNQLDLPQRIRTVYGMIDPELKPD